MSAVGVLQDDAVMGEQVLVSGAVAARAVGVAPSTIRSWVARKHLQPVGRNGAFPVFDLDDVFEAERRIRTEPRRRVPSTPAHDAPPCVALTSAGRDCPRRSVPDAPVSLCREHLLRAAQFVADEEDEAVAMALSRVAQRRLTQQLAGTDLTAPSVVYLVQRGDLVKIGTTTRFVHRMQELMPDRVLRVLPGDRVQERALHHVFSEDRVRYEWFRRSAALIDFIESTADQDVMAEVGGAPTLWGDLTNAPCNATL